jgi:hypothetical protein
MRARTSLRLRFRGIADNFATIRHAEEAGKPCWLVHHPYDGPLFEFGAISEVTAFLAYGDGSCCRREFAQVSSGDGVIIGGGMPRPRRTQETEDEQQAYLMEAVRAYRGRAAHDVNNLRHAPEPRCN